MSKRYENEAYKQYQNFILAIREDYIFWKQGSDHVL